MLNSRNSAALETAICGVEDDHLRFDGLAFDASKEHEVEEGFRRILERHGVRGEITRMRRSVI